MKTIREIKSGKRTLRLLQTKSGFAGLVIVGGAVQVRLEGPDGEALWQQLHRESAKGGPDYVGFAGARTRFLQFFPGGFDDYYRGRERDYKVAAREKLIVALPLTQAATAPGGGEAALAAFRATNMLSPFEKTRLLESLRSSHADDFVRGAARFAGGETARGLSEMATALRHADVAKWTAVTYLPFLWNPHDHMFLKPMVTTEFAARVGHPFADVYSPELKEPTYESLLDLVAITEKEIADLKPVDRIDVQSFIWVVGAYDSAADGPPAET